MCLSQITPDTIWECWNEVVSHYQDVSLPSEIFRFLDMAVTLEDLDEGLLFNIVRTLYLAEERQTEKDREFAEGVCV